ncbi:DUF2062 domain-containing protein [Marinobacterium weihaiense]
MPDEQMLRSHRHLSWLGRHLHDPNLWHLTRKSVARAFMVGILCAFMPIPGQMIVAAVLAILASSNLPISVGLVWITNPFTIPPIFYACYRLGSWMLGVESGINADWSWELATIKAEFNAIWWPLLLGSTVSGIVCSLIGYIAISRFWIWHVNRSWRKRIRSRLKRHNR